MPTTRRRFLQGVTVTSLASVAPRAWGVASLAVPTIDRLSLSIVVDAATFAFAAAIDRADLQVERAPPRPADETEPRRTLAAEFGFSVLAESQRHEQTRRVLIDFGYTPEVLRNNLALQHIELASIDAMVLSHGHFDHFGGMQALLSPDAHLKPDVPLFVGGEEIFCARETLLRGQAQSFGTVPRDQLLAAGIKINSSPMPAVVADHAFVTGEIPRASFERTINPTFMRPGVGCQRQLLSADKRELTKLADDMRHELATCYVLRDRGLVVESSCSHRGILNAIERARAISGVDHVHAVIGGFHLVWPRTEEEAVQTVDALEKINPDYVIPMHCTGELFIAEGAAANAKQGDTTLRR